MIRKRAVVGCVWVFGIAACSENADTGKSLGSAGNAGAQSATTGGSMSASGAAGVGGVYLPSSATNAEDCSYRGGAGGADAVPCDYVSVQFSQPLPTDGLEIEVNTSNGDHLVPITGSFPGFAPPPTLSLDVTPDGTEASGFGLRMIAGQDYSPEWVDVVVRDGDATLADARLLPMYSCVALTVDDWCWMAGTETLQVTLP